MKMNFFCALALVVFLSSFLQSVSAQTMSNSIRDRKLSIKADNEPLAKVFHQLIYELGIPIGFEESNLDEGHRDFYFETNPPEHMSRNGGQRYPANGSLSYDVHLERVFPKNGHLITLNFENASIDKVFDSIVRQMSNYKWEIADDIINIYPKDGRDPRLIELLNTVVHEFILGETATLIMIQPDIYDLPEFTKFLSERNLGVTGVRSNAQDLKSRIPQGIKLSNVKLKQVLNRLAKIKAGGWILKVEKRMSEEGKEIIELDI
jgi:hypothetical protein